MDAAGAILVGWFIFGFVVGVVADSRGRGGIAWFFIAMLISPLVAFIALALMPKVVVKDAKAERHVVQRRTKRCPLCAEEILYEAVRCKHCGADMPPELLPRLETDEEAVVRFGIKRDSGQYIYGKYRYTELSEALAIARRENGES